MIHLEMMSDYLLLKFVIDIIIRKCSLRMKEKDSYSFIGRFKCFNTLFDVFARMIVNIQYICK